MRLNQTYLNGNITYILLRQTGGVEALAIYNLLVRNYSHKRICFNGCKTKVMKTVAKVCGVSLNTLNSGLTLLIKYKLVAINEYGLFISPNKFINEKYLNPKNKKGEVLIPSSIYMDKSLTYSQLKLKIRNLLVYSNAKEQIRVSRKKAHIYSIISRFGTAHFKEVKKVKDYFKKRGLPFSDKPSELIATLNYHDEISMCHKKHAKLINRKSTSTAARHKKKLMEQDKQIKFVPRVSNRTYCSITEHYAAITNGSIPPYSKYKNGYSYYDLPTEILICSPTYYNNSLYSYTNKRILNPTAKQPLPNLI